jgi:hypothetical protein
MESVPSVPAEQTRRTLGGQVAALTRGLDAAPTKNMQDERPPSPLNTGPNSRDQFGRPRTEGARA